MELNVNNILKLVDNRLPSGHKKFRGHLAAISVICFLTACCSKDETPYLNVPATTFNQKLTDAVREKETVLSSDIEAIQCYGSKRIIDDNEVECNVFLRGHAINDMNSKFIFWSIPVRNAKLLFEYDYPRFISPSQIDFDLLVGTGFVFVIKNPAEGLAVEVSANKDSVTIDQAKNFIGVVLPIVSVEVNKQITKARAAAPDSVRATWESK